MLSFGKVAGPQSATPLQVFFNWFAYLLRPTAYQEIEKLNLYYVIQGVLLFIFSCCELRTNRLNGQYLLSDADNKKRKANMESTV